MAPTRSTKLNVLGRRPSNYTRPAVVSEKVARDIATYARPRTVSRDHRVNRSSRLQRGSDRGPLKSRRRLITPIRTPLHNHAQQSTTQLSSVSEAPVEFILPSAQKVKLPSKLPRINIGKPVPRGNILAVAPELEEVPTRYLRDVYEQQGIALEQACKTVSLPTLDPSSIPNMKSIEMTLNDTECTPPTHVFAISRALDASSAGSTFPVDGLVLHPVHSIIPAIHCSSLPQLPFNNVHPPSTSGEKVHVPFVRLQLPFPEEFNPLLSYMYTRNPLKLMSRYVPHIGGEAMRAAAATGTRQGQVGVYAYELTQRMGWVAILRKVLALNGLVKNVCTLGVSDQGMWGVMDLCWEILLVALRVSVEKAKQQQQTQ
ncbi:hypothetical protein QCA50_013022 [Cerrena zonata]|uniref:Uncharacterized protein n=1 Tax=Cerrena zonata TaxID=2478898 RepID=A0AAW0FS80_9APHY